MKQFLIRLVYFLLPFLIGVVLVDVILKNQMRTPAKFKLKKGITAVIVGHSQSECGLNDSLIPHTQNLSFGGEAYIYNYRKLEKLVEVNPQLKKVYVSFSNNQVGENISKWTYGDEKLTHYFPKYNYLMKVEDYSNIANENPKGILISEVKSIVNNAKSVLKREKTVFNDRNWGGYLSLNKQKLDSLIKANHILKLKKEISHTESQINLYYLDKIVALCKEKNLELVFVRTPMHHTLFAVQNEVLFQKIRKSKYNDIPFLDFHDFKLNNNEFADFDHLNKEGAIKLSKAFHQQAQSK